MDHLDNCRERFEALEQQIQAMETRTRTIERRLGRWRGSAWGVVVLLGAMGIALGSVPPAHADGIQCGAVLGPGGRFELEHDLECPGVREPAVTVRDGVILDLQGHIVACPDQIGCVILTGTGAQLLNGAVRNVNHESIVLEGTGGHTVRNVTSLLVDANIIVRSDHNRLSNVMAESTNSPAFIIAGNKNLLTGNIARCIALAFDNCIEVGGSQNRLINNFVTSTTFAPPAPALRGGLRLTGDNNVLRGNRAIRNGGPGIVVTGTGNILSRNTALENSLDLQDTNGDCAQNTWEQNTFRTSDPACIQ